MADEKVGINQVKEINAANIPNRDQINAFAVKRGRETKFFAYKDLYVREGFNARIEYGDIKELALSILNNGLEIPLKVDVVNEGGVTKAYINEGHRRHRAFTWLIENGHQVESIECFVNPKGTTEEQRIFTMFVTQDNKQLEGIEIAECFNRLVNLGHTPESISNRIGKSITYVKDYLGLSKAPRELKDAVINKQLTPSAAIVLTKKVKSEEVKKEMIKDAIGKGKKFKVKDALAVDASTNEAIRLRIKKLGEITEGLPDWKQAQVNVIINFLTGNSDEAALIASLNSNQ